MNSCQQFAGKVKRKLFHIFVRKGPFYEQWKKYDSEKRKKLPETVWQTARERMFACKKDLIKLVALWYQSVHQNDGVSMNDALVYIRKMAHKRMPKWNGRIVIVSGHITARMYKIVGALSRHGVYIIMLFGPASKENAVGVKDALLSMSNEHYECACVEEMLYRIMEADASAVHWFTAWSNLDYPWLAIKARAILRKKIVVDRYDILNGMYTNIKEEQLQKEQFVLENADGICNRSFEIPFLKENMHFNIRGKVIFFQDYIDNGECPTAPVEDDNRELSLVYVGGWFSMKKYPDCTFLRLDEFATLCKANKCHFHAYLVSGDKKKFEEIVPLEKDNPYFHFHRPVSFSKLAKEISQYDYAVAPSKPLKTGQEVNGYYTKYKFVYAGMNKLYDAIDAGIPMVAKMHQKMVEMFVQAGFCIAWNIDEYDFDELRKRRYEMRRHVRAHRAEWIIDAHIDKMIDFYKAL